MSRYIRRFKTGEMFTVDSWYVPLPAVFRIHRIHMFLGHKDPDPDPLVRGMDPDPSIIKQK
jgi:hypothetical protein